MAKMNELTWLEAKWFRPEEFDDPDRLDFGLIARLDAMRDHSGKKFIVHYSTDGVHAPGSTHYAGKAVDGHSEALTVLEQYLLAESFNWPGIGIYPFWNNPGVHLDSRELGQYGKGARWWRDESGVYKPITVELLKSLT